MTPDLTVTPADLADLTTGRHAVATDDAVWRVEGPGATACLQGLVTNDLEGGTVPSLRYAAVLTPKGMIVSPLWIRRDAVGFWLVVPADGAVPLRALLGRSLPPRLARLIDRSDEFAAWRCFGDLDGPDADGLDLAIPDERAPFDAMVIGSRETTPAALEEAGWRPASAVLARLAEVLGGWPALGREIDGKTLPQEVGFDDLEGVKHDKGCYVGQETVARIHFRGHPNRILRAMVGSGPVPAERSVLLADREVGQVATLVACGDRWLATSKLRREVATGDTVTVGGREAAVASLPVDPATLAP